MLDAPPETCKRGRPVEVLKRVQERGDVLIVADVHAEGDPPLHQLAHIPLDMLTHRAGIDDDGRSIKILVVVHLELQHLAGAPIDMAMGKGGMQVVSNGDGLRTGVGLGG